MVATVRQVLAAGRYDLDVPDPCRAAAVLLHPHPQFGGDRHNIVVDALFRVLPGAGIAVVRFDFSSADVAAGTADAQDALDLLPPGVSTVMVGYSFGALVAARVTDGRVDGWVLVAPPTEATAASRIGLDPRRKLVLTARHDQFFPPEVTRAAVAGWVETDVHDIRADHFVMGATRAVVDRVIAWV